MPGGQRRTLIRALAAHWTIPTAARFLERLDLDDPDDQEHLALALRGQRAEPTSYVYCGETDNGVELGYHKPNSGLAHLPELLEDGDVTEYVRGVLALFEALDEPSLLAASPADVLAEKLLPLLADPGDSRPDPHSPPPRLRDTALCLTAPHGPTAAGVMPAAA